MRENSRGIPVLQQETQWSRQGKRCKMDFDRKVDPECVGPQAVFIKLGTGFDLMVSLIFCAVSC